MTATTKDPSAADPMWYLHDTPPGAQADAQHSWLKRSCVRPFLANAYWGSGGAESSAAGG